MLYDQLRQDFFASYENRFENAVHPDLTAGIMVPHLEEEYASLPFLFKKPIYEWMHLEIEYFPPSSHWQEEELKILCASFRQLFEAYNYFAAMPWHIEITLEYDSWLEMLKQYSACHLTLNDGTGMEYVDICKGQEHQCIFGNSCLKSGDQHCYEYQGNGNWQKYSL